MDRHCTLRIPGCRNGHTVGCHAPSVDSGMGLKSPDWWMAWGCRHCHDIVDRRTRTAYTDEELKSFWMSAIYETQSTLFREGKLLVKS